MYRGFGKGVLVSCIVLLMCAGIVTADDKKGAKISQEEAQRRALEHQINGNRYDDNGQLKEAIEEYKKSLEYVADDTNTLFNLGVAYLKTNKPEEAAEAFERLVKVSSDDVEGYNLLGIAYRGAGKKKEAKMAWEKSLKIEPNQPKVKEMINDMVAE